MRRTRTVLLGAWLLIGLGTAGAQGIEKEQAKLLAKRAAEADAYRKLAEIVYGLQINEQTTVRDFVTESDDIHGAVDAFIKGIRLGTPRWYEDLSCEVPAEVTVAKVVETLRDAHDHYYKGDHIKTSDFETLTKRIDKDVIKVIGMGAPRPELPPDLPQGAAEVLGPPPRELPKPAIPAIWAQLGPEAARARLMAIQAARLDAQRKLAERLKGLRLSSHTQVRDFVTESDEIRADMEAFLKGAEEVSTYLHSDELIAEVTMRVPTEQVITTIKSLHSRRYKNDDPDETRGHDFEEVVKTVVKKDFEATGMGVPPPKYMQAYAERVELPPWATDYVKADGQGTDPALDTPQGKLKAARAAEMDAKRKLAEQIAGLRLRGETTVREYMTAHDTVSSLVQAFIANAEVLKTEFTAEGARVTVGVPGMQVFGAVDEDARRAGREPPPPQ
jgi:hypothetical protein